MMVFQRKKWNKTSVREVDFLQIRHFFIGEMGNASSESWTK